MTSNHEIIAAVDIGTTKIVAIVGRKIENGQIDILGVGKTPSKGVKKGVVLNIEETVSAIRTAVEKAQAIANVPLSDVYVGIAGQHIKTIKNKSQITKDSFDSEITQSDVRELINNMYKTSLEAGEEIIDVLPQNYIVNGEIDVLNPVGITGNRLEANFHVIIGQITSANNIKKSIKRVGLNINSLIYEPLASAEAVLNDDEKKLGVALVDIGGGTTDVAIYYNDTLYHTAIIPFGGDAVTNDIKEGCLILDRYAEALKLQYGSALADLAQHNKFVSVPGIRGREPKEVSCKNLARIIQARMEEIVDAIHFETKASGVADKLGAGVVITGGGSLLKNLSQLISYKMNMDVRLGCPNEYVSDDVEVDITHPSYSTAVGLLLKGNADKDKDLFKPEELFVEEVEVKKEEPVKHQATISKKNIFVDLKGKLGGLFEVDDSEM